MSCIFQRKAQGNQEKLRLKLEYHKDMQDNELALISEEEMIKRGERLAELLYLKKDRQNGDYQTDWGTKTAKGLYLTVLGVIEGKLA